MNMLSGLSYGELLAFQSPYYLTPQGTRWDSRFASAVHDSMHDLSVP